MKKLLKIFAVMFIVSVALLAVAAYVPNGDVADAVTADCTHEYSEVVLAQQPSCTQKGWLEHYTCTLCGKYFVKVGEDMVEVDWEDISSPVLVHKWSDWFVKPATCTEEGGEMRYCALCGETKHRGDTIGALEHNLTHHEAVASTCTAVGTKAHYECSVCHKLFVDGESGKVEVSAEELVIPATGHTVVTDEGKAPTCTETGLTEGSHCSVCGTVLVAQEVIPVTGHTVVTDEGKAPTCTETGLTEGSHCSVCGTVLVAQEEIPTTEHTVVVDKAVESTCTETGLTEGSHCSVCGTVLVAQQEIPATGHTYDAVTTGDNVCTVCHQHEITQAEIVEKLYALENGKALAGTYLLTGIVTNLDDTNATIIVEEKEIYLYSSTNTFLVGDRVSVVGTLKHFDNYYEFDKGTVKGVTHPEYTLTFGANVEGCTVTLADGSHVPTSATSGTTYEVKITAPSGGYKVASVTVNGAAVDMSESGTYSVTVCGETTVHVEIVSKMSQQEVVLTFPDGNSAKISSYTNEWSVTLGENTWNITNANNNKNGWDYIRIGAKSSTSTSTISFTSEKSVSKIVVYTAYIRGSATATLSVVNSQGETILSTEPQTIGNGTESVAFDVSGAKQNCTYVLTFVCTNTNSKNGVIDISKVTYTSVVCEHEWGTWAHKSDATCTESATESRICDLCGAEEVRTVGEPLGHTWGDWTSNGNGTHTGTCTREGCDYTVKEDCTFVDGVCSVCNAQEVITHSVTVGYTVNGNAATTLPEGVTVEILGKDGQPVTDLANVVEGTTLTVKVKAEGFGIVVTCNSEPLTLQDGEGTFDVNVDVTLSVTLTTQTEHKGTAEDPYSVADALAIASVIGQGNYTEKVYIKGLIVDVGSEGDYLSNIYIADTADGTKMLVYSANFSETVATIYKGDTVVFHGYITNYKGTLEIAGKDEDYPEMTAVTRGSRTITVQMENATIATPTGDLPTSAPIESTVTFTVTADEGYEVVSVKVNDNILTAVDGTYSFVVGETNAVVVTTQVITTKHQVSVNGNVEGYTVTTDNGIKLPGEVSEGRLKFTVTAPEGYQVATVSVGGAVLTADADGYYTTEVASEITINITFKAKTTYESSVVFAELGYENAQEVTDVVKDYVTFTSSIGSNTYGNKPKYYNDGSALRIYINNTITIAVPDSYEITQMIFTFDDGFNSKLLNPDNGAFDGNVWNGNSNRVIITATDTCRIQSVTVVYGLPCQHEWSYVSNNNGTHTGTCSLCGQEITEDCTFVAEVCEVCKGNQPVHNINQSVQDAVITTPNGENLPDTALHGTELAFTITPEEGFVVTEVKVNGETVEAVEGVYTITVKATVNIEVTTQEESTVPAEPTLAAQFNLGEDGSAKHFDGNSTTQYTETQNGYTLTLTSSANVYSKATDATGNGCLKLGTSEKAGSFSFTVPESVTIVKIYVAGYKAKDATVTINNVATALTCHSDDGEYDCIEIDVSAVKTVEFKVSSGYRCMINTIEFYE